MIKNFVRPWTVTLLVGLIYVSWILYLGGGDPLVFVGIGSRFSEGNPTGTEGYDGQFAYFIATDPASAPAEIDVPAYRFQRILYPLLARLLSGGNIAVIPWLLIALNLAGLAGGVWLAELLLADLHINQWYALPIGLYAGQLLSIRVDLPEPLALLFVLWAMWFFERRQHIQGSGWLLSSALLFSLAIFSKETMLITGLAFVGYLLSQKEIKKSLILSAILIIPFGLYQLYLYVWLGSFGIGAGGAGSTPFEIIPFGGLFKVVPISWTVFLLFLLILGPIVIWPTLWSLYVTGKDTLRGQWHPWTLALGMNALVIPFLPHSTFREPLAMLRFTVPLVALIILYSARSNSRRAINYSFLWLATLVFLVNDPLLL